jgi:hypothetical protein
VKLCQKSTGDTRKTVELPEDDDNHEGLPVIYKENKKSNKEKQHKLLNPYGLGDKTSTEDHPGGKQTPCPNGREKQNYPPMVETIEGQKPPRELGGPETPSLP